MATAEDLRKEFMEFMDAKDMHYTVMDEEDNMVYLAFGGETDTFVMVDFDEDGDDASSVHFSSLGFAKVEQDDMAAALVKLNEVNTKYRWATFFIHDNELSANCDAKIYPGSVGPECFELAIRLSNIIEDAIKDFAGIATPDEEKMKMLSFIAAMKRAGL